MRTLTSKGLVGFSPILLFASSAACATKAVPPIAGYFPPNAGEYVQVVQADGTVRSPADRAAYAAADLGAYGKILAVVGAPPLFPQTQAESYRLTIAGAFENLVMWIERTAAGWSFVAALAPPVPSEFRFVRGARAERLISDSDGEEIARGFGAAGMWKAGFREVKADDRVSVDLPLWLFEGSSKTRYSFAAYEFPLDRIRDGGGEQALKLGKRLAQLLPAGFLTEFQAGTLGLRGARDAGVR